MCKHKSGGMSKPSGATDHTSGLPSDNSAACATSNCTSSSNPTTTNTRRQDGSKPAAHNQLKKETVLLLKSDNSQDTMAVGTHREGSSSDKAYNYEQTEIQESSNGSEKVVEDLSSASAVIVEEWIETSRPNSPESEDDHADEDSPMLLGQNSPLPGPCSKVWACSNLPPLQPWDASSTVINFDSLGNCACASSYDSNKEDSYAVGCDKNPTFRNFNTLGSFQLPTTFGASYGLGGCAVLDGSDDVIEMNDTLNVSEDQCSCPSRSGKRWVFAKHKCKSLECESSQSYGHNLLSHTVVCQRSASLQSADDPRTMESVDKSSIVDSSNSCLSTTYSASTVNTEPVPGPSGLQRPNSIHWEIGTKDNGEDEEFRCRSFSLTPTINFAIFETESSSETEDAPEADILAKLEDKTTDTTIREGDAGFHIPLPAMSRVLPGSPSAAQLSLASSFGDSGAPICKICHMTAKESDPLISPCRCSGTMQYIHCGCLMRWLEISSKRSRKPPSCELCQYQYHWHKKFKVRHWQFPHCSRRDKILHLLFFISVMVMIACATITIMCFKQDKGTKIDPDRTELTHSEIVTLVCGVLFFLAFFVAMYVEVKARNTIYKLLVKFVYLNQQWYIDEYDKKNNAPVAV